MSQLKNSVTHAYNFDWQDKLIDPERLNLQRRVSYAINKLFTEIIRSPFKGDVLDLGCGDGMLVKSLSEFSAVDAKGIDINHGIDFEIDRLPFNDNAFNIAIMYSVIEHIHNPGNIMTELKRILKESGYLVIITSNFDLANSYICDRKFYDDPTHIHPYNLKSLTHLMRLYGFSKSFAGLWTVPKTAFIWKLPTMCQFYIGAILPFPGTVKIIPSFLKGKSRTMLCVFKNGK